MAKASRWLSLFREFVKDARISSKEISSQDERGVKLELWASQRMFLDSIGQGIDDGIRVFNYLKSRQLGVTTISLLIDVFWLAMHPNLSAALVTDSEKNRDIDRSIIERYVKSFPDGYFGDEFRITKANRQFIQFSNGSRLDFLVAGVKKKGLSWSEGVGYAMAHETEVAKYGDPEALASFHESLAQQNPDRLVIRESTANGFNMWKDIWQAGKDSLTERSFFLGWWSGDMNVIPRNDVRFAQYGGYAASGEERELVATVLRMYGHKITPEQLAWIRWREATAGSAEGDILQQNQPWTETQAFVMTGYSFFQTRMIGQDIKRIMDGGKSYGYMGYRYEFGSDFFQMKMEPETEDISRVELRVWEEPVEGGKYVIGMDPAYGRNAHKDRHCIEVWRCFADCMVQVAEYATADVEVKHATWVLAHLAGAYEDCIMNVELGGPGRMVMQELDHLRGLLNSEMNLSKVKAKDWTSALGNARWYLYNRADSMGKGFVANFETTWRTKQELMHQMRGSFVTRELNIRSIPLLEEMRIVVQDGDEIGAPESKSENSKDDRVFATALACRAWINWRRPELLANGQTYESVMSIESGETSLKTQRMNNIVFNFLKNADERANMPPSPDKWKVDRGLA